MARRITILAIALLIGLTFSACGSKPTPDVQAIETQTAAKIFATLTASVPTQTPTPKTTPTAQPTATPEAIAMPQAVVDAVKSLRKMAGATEIGINYQEYGSRMIDLKAEVDGAIAQLPDGELKTELGLAMETYVDALTAWSQAVQYDFLLLDYEPAKSLQAKYSIPEEKGLSGSMLMYRDTTLSIIWKVAGEHVKRASELVGQ